MTGARLFLLAEALLWLPYGIYCLLVPGVLAQGAGVVAETPTGVTELRAMYGGLQMAIGVASLWGAFSDSFRRHALVLLFVLTMGIGLGRLFGLILDGSASLYTVLALVFELVTAVIAGRILSRGAA